MGQRLRLLKSLIQVETSPGSLTVEVQLRCQKRRWDVIIHTRRRTKGLHVRSKDFRSKVPDGSGILGGKGPPRPETGVSYRLILGRRRTWMPWICTYIININGSLMTTSQEWLVTFYRFRVYHYYYFYYYYRHK